MTLKTLVITTLLLLSSGLAAAQTYTFGFMSVDGDLFCNYEELTQPIPGGLWSVTDNQSVCGLPNIYALGVSTKLSKAGNPAGFALKGVEYDYFYASYNTSYQYYVFSKLECSTKRYGWLSLASTSGFIFGDDYGFLSCSIPGRNTVPTKGRTTDRMKVTARK